MNKKSSKIVVISFILLIIISLFNLSNITINSKNKNLLEEKEREHINFAEKYNRLEFSSFIIKDVVSGAKREFNINKGIVILLANNGCSPCQVRELKTIGNLIKNTNMDIIALYVSGYDRINALKLMKVTAFPYPIFFIRDKSLNGLFYANLFPKVFYVENQKIISTLIPIPNNKNFSEKFYSSLTY